MWIRRNDHRAVPIGLPQCFVLWPLEREISQAIVHEVDIVPIERQSAAVIAKTAGVGDKCVNTPLGVVKAHRAARDQMIPLFASRKRLFNYAPIAGAVVCISRNEMSRRWLSSQSAMRTHLKLSNSVSRPTAASWGCSRNTRGSR